MNEPNDMENSEPTFSEETIKRNKCGARNTKPGAWLRRPCVTIMEKRIVVNAIAIARGLRPGGLYELHITDRWFGIKSMSSTDAEYANGDLYMLKKQRGGSTCLFNARCFPKDATIKLGKTYLLQEKSDGSAFFADLSKPLD